MKTREQLKQYLLAAIELMRHEGTSERTNKNIGGIQNILLDYLQDDPERLLGIVYTEEELEKLTGGS